MVQNDVFVVHDKTVHLQLLVDPLYSQHLPESIVKVHDAPEGPADSYSGIIAAHQRPDGVDQFAADIFLVHHDDQALIVNYAIC